MSRKDFLIFYNHGDDSDKNAYEVILTQTDHFFQVG